MQELWSTPLTPTRSPRAEPGDASLPLSDTDTCTFNLSELDYADKIVFSLHSHDNWTETCIYFQVDLYNRGLNTLDVSA